MFPSTTIFGIGEGKPSHHEIVLKAFQTVFFLIIITLESLLRLLGCHHNCNKNVGSYFDRLPYNTLQKTSPTSN